MATGGRVSYRAFYESDRSQFRKFHCINPRELWGRPPQRDIRRAPRRIDEGVLDARILVAVDPDDGTLLGAIVIGPDPTRPDTDYVHAIGVITDRQNEGIATELKRYAMTVTAAQYGRRVIGSEVICKNGRMRQVNAKLHVDAELDPDNPKFMVTTVTVTPSRPPAT